MKVYLWSFYKKISEDSIEVRRKIYSEEEVQKQGETVWYVKTIASDVAVIKTNDLPEIKFKLDENGVFYSNIELPESWKNDNKLDIMIKEGLFSGKLHELAKETE